MSYKFTILLVCLCSFSSYSSENSEVIKDTLYLSKEIVMLGSKGGELKVEVGIDYSSISSTGSQPTALSLSIIKQAENIYVKVLEKKNNSLIEPNRKIELFQDFKVRFLTISEQKAEKARSFQEFTKRLGVGFSFGEMESKGNVGFGMYSDVTYTQVEIQAKDGERYVYSIYSPLTRWLSDGGESLEIIEQKKLESSSTEALVKYFEKAYLSSDKIKIEKAISVLSKRGSFASVLKSVSTQVNHTQKSPVYFLNNKHFLEALYDYLSLNKNGEFSVLKSFTSSISKLEELNQGFGAKIFKVVKSKGGFNDSQLRSLYKDLLIYELGVLSKVSLNNKFSESFPDDKIKKNIEPIWKDLKRLFPSKEAQKSFLTGLDSLIRIRSMSNYYKIEKGQGSSSIFLYDLEGLRGYMIVSRYIHKKYKSLVKKVSVLKNSCVNSFKK